MKNLFRCFSYLKGLGQIKLAAASEFRINTYLQKTKTKIFYCNFLKTYKMKSATHISSIVSA